jgi:hypothetical protein
LIECDREQLKKEGLEVKDKDKEKDSYTKDEIIEII